MGVHAVHSCGAPLLSVRPMKPRLLFLALLVSLVAIALVFSATTQDPNTAFTKPVSAAATDLLDNPAIMEDASLNAVGGCSFCIGEQLPPTRAYSVVRFDLTLCYFQAE